MLDPQGRKEVLEVAKQLNKEENITIIWITHYMDEAVDADRVAIMNDARIVNSSSSAFSVKISPSKCKPISLRLFAIASGKGKSKIWAYHAKKSSNAWTGHLKKLA